MGIKGIYKEIGAGKRISLAKLAVDQLKETGRPLRMAIDISIWQFQVQAAKGGTNPAIRTLFYRLLRLLGLSIQPIFVFDGPNKPAFKRNKRSGRGDGVAASMARRMVRLFGFVAHDAPGEAEAECALLQLHGIVDAVLSEDVDTIMFGCTKTLRNWSAEGKSGSTPTHVSLYDTALLGQAETGLDREGMVLVALMSGGDYLPEGIPGAGIKLACEAARAGFGRSLCRIKRNDANGLTEWREKLIHELRTNESNFFRRKHKALEVPSDFPNMEILRYYTHPVVSAESTLEKLKCQKWDNRVDVVALRRFVCETFDWTCRAGAIKFIRVLAPSLLVRKIMALGMRRESSSCPDKSVGEEKADLIGAIKLRREHSSTDSTPELRVSFKPTDIVGYAFEEEPEETVSYSRGGLALNSDDEFDAGGEDGNGTEGNPKLLKKPYVPTEPDLSWIPEAILRHGVPLMVQGWEEAQRAKLLQKKTKASNPKTQKETKGKPGGVTAGLMDKFVQAIRVTKSTTGIDGLSQKFLSSTSPSRDSSPPQSSPLLVSSVEQDEQILSSQLPSVPPLPIASCRENGGSKETATRKSRPPLSSSVSFDDWIPTSTLPTSNDVPRMSNSSSQPTIPTPVESILVLSSPPASPPGPSQKSPKRTASPERRRRNEIYLLSSSPIERSTTPPCESPPKNSETHPETQSFRSSLRREASATPQTVERERRKLARTESMPMSSPRGQRSPSLHAADLAMVGKPVPRCGLRRANTIAVPEIDPFEISSSDSDSDDDDLPTLNRLMGMNMLPKARQPGTLVTKSMISAGISSTAPISTQHPRARATAPAKTRVTASEPPTIPDRASRAPSLFTGISQSINVQQSKTKALNAKPVPSKNATTTTMTRKKQATLPLTHGSGLKGLRTTKAHTTVEKVPGPPKELDVEMGGAGIGDRDVGGEQTGRSAGRVGFVDLTGDD